MASSAALIGLDESKLLPDKSRRSSQRSLSMDKEERDRRRADVERHNRCCEDRVCAVWQEDVHLEKLYGDVARSTRALGGDRRAMEVLRSVVWEGIPHHLRCEIWPVVTRAHDRAAVALSAVAGPSCRELFHQTIDSLRSQHRVLKTCRDASAMMRVRRDAAKDIEKDVPRTFAGHRTKVNTPHGQSALRFVLRAHAAYNRAVGYAQSLNMHAALMLSVENMKIGHAFWLLVTLTTFVAPGYHVPTMGYVRSSFESSYRTMRLTLTRPTVVSSSTCALLIA